MDANKIYNKEELDELFKSKQLLHKNYNWYFNNLLVDIIAVYNEPVARIKDINQSNKYKIIPIVKE